MGCTFQFVGLCDTAFSNLFVFSDKELAASNALRVIADSNPGYPCRVSLEEAEVGETILLLPCQHLDVSSPYRASGPIYVRQGVAQAKLGPGEIPPVLTRRLMSIRAYDSDGMMVSADVVQPEALSVALNGLFGMDEVEFVDVHNAKHGCFAARATRAYLSRPSAETVKLPSRGS